MAWGTFLLTVMSSPSQPGASLDGPTFIFILDAYSPAKSSNCAGFL
jgi:hypothetical protein